MRFLLLLSLSAAAVLAAPEPATLETLRGTLYGTLELPATSGPYPLVILHAGSGPTDRDGNTAMLQGKNNSLRLVAEALAARGIASLRYDKRGIAASAKAAPPEEALRFEIYVNDLVAWGQQYRRDKRFRALLIAGHSEGALIGAIAAGQLKADGYISLEGAGSTAGQVLRTQLRPRVPPDKFPQIEAILASLEAGQTVETPPELNALFRARVQPYLISWLRYNPTVEIAKLKMPVLIVQGTTDLQIPVSEGRQLALAKQDAQFVLIEGMNHVLKLASGTQTEQMASYQDPALPVAPKLMETLAAFIGRVAPAAR